MQPMETNSTTDHGRLSSNRSLDLVRHSPAGFDWGYVGSDPTQLTCAHLLDYTDNEIDAHQHYIQFRDAVVSQLVCDGPADGWDDSGRDADHVTARKTVRHSLARVRQFWIANGISPETTPEDGGMNVEYEGPSPADLEQAACTECGTNVWRTRRGPYVAEYDTGAICGYCSYECYFSHRHRNHLEEIAGEQSVYLPPA